MGLEHATTRKGNDGNRAAWNHTRNWGRNVIRKLYAASRETIVRGGNFTFWTCKAAWLWVSVAVGLAVLATGCQRMYWYQDGKTFDECRADYEDCQAELLKRTDRRYASSYKYRFLDNCMRERGYEVVAEKGLPLDVAREDPMVPSDWPGVHAYGVAGTLRPRPPSPAPEGAPVKPAALRRGVPPSLVSPRAAPRPGSTSSSR